LNLFSARCPLHRLSRHVPSPDKKERKLAIPQRREKILLRKNTYLGNGTLGALLHEL
jgi:hypothetical protein